MDEDLHPLISAEFAGQENHDNYRGSPLIPVKSPEPFL